MKKTLFTLLACAAVAAPAMADGTTYPVEYSTKDYITATTGSKTDTGIEEASDLTVTPSATTTVIEANADLSALPDLSKELELSIADSLSLTKWVGSSYGYGVYVNYVATFSFDNGISAKVNVPASGSTGTVTVTNSAGSKSESFNLGSDYYIQQGDKLTFSSTIAWDDEGTSGKGFYFTYTSPVSNTTTSLFLTDSENISWGSYSVTYGLRSNTVTAHSSDDQVDANSPFTTITYNTPEPATATLSLLALAGLAARRRRK